MNEDDTTLENKNVLRGYEKSMSNTKRIKLDNKNDIEITSILDDSYSQLPDCRRYYASKIDDKKNTNLYMRELNQKIPLDCISYVRRVNTKNEILVCAADDANEESIESLKAFLKSKEILKELIEIFVKEIRVVKIPISQPKLRWQFEILTKEWPCKFHENKYLERLYNNTLFSASELDYHRKNIEICKFISSEVNKCSTGIAVNPYNHRIVSFGYSKTSTNPIIHCVMDLIDQVAITQGGGCYSSKHTEFYSKIAKKVSEKFSVEFGECEFEKSATSSDNLHRFGPYLCTGYFIYLLNEPCLMCSMALTHSRAKRVFYHRANCNVGALGTTIKFHTNKNLNHHYEVFHVAS